MSTPVSALQRNAAAVIRRIASSGQSEEITDRGRVVALLSPPPKATGLDRLREAGATRPPTTRTEDLRALLAEAASLPALRLGDALAEQRADER